MRINPEKIARYSVVTTLLFMLCWGTAMVVMQVKPFWVDEWRIIYNLKFKDSTALWGQLDFMQQFPRLYLQLIKVFSSQFDYSYYALRLPSFLVGIATIILGIRLTKRIYPAGGLNSFLFIMILVSSYTFTEYFVQVKQYTMDIFLSLLAIWQYTELLKVATGKTFRKGRYIGLCISMLLAPFFSYTYPIAITPAFFIIIIHAMQQMTVMRYAVWKQLLPLVLSAVGIAGFYVSDVAQLMNDSGMHVFWGHLMMRGGFDIGSFFANVHMLFAEVGSGFVFWFIFGVVGLAAFAVAMYKGVAYAKQKELTTVQWMVLYSLSLVLFVILLFSLGKFPLGEPRLNAFTVPAIAVLIIHLLDHLLQRQESRKAATVLSFVLYAGVIGNVYTTAYACFSGDEYKMKLQIYRTTEKALTLAHANQLPIVISPGVAFPYDSTINFPYKNTVPGDWVIKTFPAYKADRHLPVYAISDLKLLSSYLSKLPPYVHAVLAGDGRSFTIIKR